MKSKVKEQRPDIGEIKDYLLTPAVGAHGGPGAITIGYILNK